ncbi:MAG TPA: flagellar biosynthetic protein FliO [Solirubrobacteraceae bacterium]|jgi:flagellar protein FliO/FliZ|nr:flagellar biosynthetic protein FliO [Solirubrobacteraceae bacterium]
MKSLTLIRGARFACALTLLYAVALWCSSPALAAVGTSTSFENTPVTTSTNPLPHASSGDFTGTVIRTIVGLLIVIAVIYGLSWILKQAKAARNPSTGEGLVQIASLPLGPNRSLALVRVGAELHLLGVAEHGITSVRVFSEEEAYELGIPFDPDEFDSSGGTGGPQPVQRLVESLRRFTVR